MANIKQVFDTIRITSNSGADHSIFFDQIDKMAEVFGGINTEPLKTFWKRLDRVRGKNPALVQMAWKNYILQVNALEIMFETNYTSLKQALEAAQEAQERGESECQQDKPDTSTSCQESPAAESPATQQPTTTQEPTPPATPCES